MAVFSRDNGLALTTSGICLIEMPPATNFPLLPTGAMLPTTPVIHPTAIPPKTMKVFPT